MDNLLSHGADVHMKNIREKMLWTGYCFSAAFLFSVGLHKIGRSYQGEGPARLLKEVGGTSGEVEMQGLLLDVGLAGGSGI